MYLLRVPLILTSVALLVLLLDTRSRCQSAYHQANPSQSAGSRSYSSGSYHHYYGHGYRHYGHYSSHGYRHYGHGYGTSGANGTAAGQSAYSIGSSQPGSPRHGRYHYYHWWRDASGQKHYEYYRNSGQNPADNTYNPEARAQYGPSWDLEEPLSRRDQAAQEQKMRAAKAHLALMEQRLARQRHERRLRDKEMAAQLLKAKK